MKRTIVMCSLLVLGAAAGLQAQTAPALPLPSGVTLRITTPTASVIGQLLSQSGDSVWLTPAEHSTVQQVVAISRVQRVERRQTLYWESAVAGGAVGLAVGALAYVARVQRDHGVVFGGGATAGAAAGLIFPLTRWVPVPVR